MANLTNKELSELLVITDKKLRTIRNAGLIRFHKFGRSYSYTEEAVNDFLSLTENVDLSSDDKIIAFGLTLKKHVQPASKERAMSTNLKDS